MTRAPFRPRQNALIWTITLVSAPDRQAIQIGGYRVTAATSDRHTARPVFQVGEPIDSVRDISKWVESLIDSQINLICALLEAVSLGDAPGAVTRALIGI